MVMETQSQTTNRLKLFVIINLLLLICLLGIPIEGWGVDLCIYKCITGKECFNCGMTRAFLSIFHFKFKDAISYNSNVIIVFPYVIIIYLYSWYKYIFTKGLLIKKR